MTHQQINTYFICALIIQSSSECMPSSVGDANIKWKGSMNKTMKSIPVLYERKEDCCGCSACYAICPKGAIVMKEDEEGFEYPLIRKDMCVRCGMCLKVCPIKAAREK